MFITKPTIKNKNNFSNNNFKNYNQNQYVILISLICLMFFNLDFFLNYCYCSIAPPEIHPRVIEIINDAIGVPHELLDYIPFRDFVLTHTNIKPKFINTTLASIYMPIFLSSPDYYLVHALIPIEFLSDLIMSNYEGEHDVLTYITHVDSYIDELMEEIRSSGGLEYSEKRRLINGYPNPEELQIIVEDFVDIVYEENYTAWLRSQSGLPSTSLELTTVSSPRN